MSELTSYLILIFYMYFMYMYFGTFFNVFHSILISFLNKMFRVLAKT